MSAPSESAPTNAHKIPAPVMADQVVDGPMRAAYSRTVILLLAASIALMMTGIGIVMPVFARRLDALGGGVAALGWMTMAFAGAQFLAAPVMGALADRIGRRPLILLALAAFALANVGYVLAPTIPVFVVIRGLAGALTAGLSPAAMSMVADTVPEKERARWIGILMGGYGIGLIFGPVIGGVIYDLWGFAAPFWISAGMGALAFISALILVPETRTPALRLRETLRQRRDAQRLSQQSAGAESWLASLPKPLTIFLTLLLVDFAGAFAFAFVEPEMIFYVYNQLNWSTAQFGLVVAVYGVAMLIGQTTLAQASDRFGRRPVIVIGALLNATLYAGIAFLTDFPLILMTSAVAGLGAALISPALSAFLLDITDERHRSRVLGIKSATLSLGGVLGPLLVTFATQITTSQGVFLLAGSLIVVSALLALALLREPRDLRRTNTAAALGQDPQRAMAAQAALHGLVMQAVEARTQAK